MKIPQIIIIFLAGLTLTSCKKEIKIDNEEVKPGIGEIYFQKGIKEKDPKQMLSNFKEGMANVDSRKDSISLYLLDGIIYVQKRQNNYKAALDYTDSLIKTAELQKNTYFVALGYYRKAAVFQALNNSEEAFKNYYTSRDLFLQIGDSSRAGQRSVEMANAQSRMADYHGSQENATSALKLLLKAKDSSYINSAYNAIAISYRERGFYEDAIKEYRNALRYSISTKDSLSFLNNIALAYRDNGNYPSALSTFKGVLDKMEVADEDSKARFIDNYAYTKWMQDSSSPVLDELTQALELRLKSKDLDGLTASYEHFSNYYEKEKPALALDYALKWLETAKKNSSQHSELNALKRIIRISPGESSKIYTNRFITLNDSLQNAQLKAKNTFAKIKFDEEQKQQEINNLEAETIKQHLETEELKNQILIASLLGLLLVVSSGFAFYYLRQKHEKEKIKESYQTESRISKKIHDELANDIYNIMSELQKIAPNNMIDKLEQIYKRTRNISKENSSIPMGENYQTHLLSTLSSTISANTKLILRGENKINWSNIKPEKKIILYRVLQEIMINMNKHSNASLVAIVFSEEKNFLKIHYSDNGIGVTDVKLKSGNGVQNMENRILSIKGSLNFETSKEKGLSIVIQIPI
ncbi:tetratricopeptide repeat protein [Gillisia sp. Hel_I_29]|uniref:tetratricopeptide repeat-containing sensor histidine kinase n=1 Tax=Gillisia sp. Hel_I_29 TaxID=1249975 RepID=UPI00054D6A94|nr:tetratricopeptide repeat protein [Gillisia sp. Hel_I_29]